jgi:hypothetical protein
LPGRQTLARPVGEIDQYQAREPVIGDRRTAPGRYRSRKRRKENDSVREKLAFLTRPVSLAYMIRQFDRFLQAIVTLAIDCGYPNVFLASIAIGAAALIVLVLQIFAA